METINILTVIGGIMLSVIGYFLKRTMDELKEVKIVAYKNQNEINVMKNDNKHLTDNIDKLHQAVRELTNEIKELNRRPPCKLHDKEK